MEIKDIYLSVYKKKLAEEILENYNGVLQRILLGLLDGMCNLHFFNTCFSAIIILCSKLINKVIRLSVWLFVEPWEKLAVEEPKVLCMVSFLSSPERLSTNFKFINLL